MPTNADRRGFAMCAVDAYYRRTRHTLGPDDGDTDEWHEVMSDLLCDLQHLAESKGLEWRALIDRAAGHHVEEVAEEGVAS